MNWVQNCLKIFSNDQSKPKMQEMIVLINVKGKFCTYQAQNSNEIQIWPNAPFTLQVNQLILNQLFELDLLIGKSDKSSHLIG